MNRKRNLTYIRRFLAKFDARLIDFNEPYVFNCPPSVLDGFYLDRIKVMEDGTLSFGCLSWDDGAATAVIESGMTDEAIQDVWEFLKTNRSYIKKYATFYYNESK